MDADDDRDHSRSLSKDNKFVRDPHNRAAQKTSPVAYMRRQPAEFSGTRSDKQIAVSAVASG